MSSIFMADNDSAWFTLPTEIPNHRHITYNQGPLRSDEARKRISPLRCRRLDILTKLAAEALEFFARLGCAIDDCPRLLELCLETCPHLALLGQSRLILLERLDLFREAKAT